MKCKGKKTWEVLKEFESIDHVKIYKNAIFPNNTPQYSPAAHSSCRQSRRYCL